MGKEVCFLERYNSDKCLKYLVQNVCAGDTELVDLNYLPELPSLSVDERRDGFSVFSLVLLFC